jgi:hypothetical protein
MRDELETRALADNGPALTATIGNLAHQVWTVLVWLNARTYYAPWKPDHDCRA